MAASTAVADLGKRLLEASRKGNAEEVRQLMATGAPITTDWLGTSPLHLAAQYGHSLTAEVLLRAGVSRDGKTKVDKTPLHLASQHGHFDIAEMLIKNGAGVNHVDMLNMTPLHWAVEAHSSEICKLLMTHGATTNTRSKFGKTAMDIIKEKDYNDLIDILMCSNYAQFNNDKQNNNDSLYYESRKRARTRKFPMTAGSWTGGELQTEKGDRPRSKHARLTFPERPNSADGSSDRESVANGNNLSSLVDAAAMVRSKAHTTNQTNRISESMSGESQQRAIPVLTDASVLDTLATLATASTQIITSGSETTSLTGAKSASHQSSSLPPGFITIPGVQGPVQILHANPGQPGFVNQGQLASALPAGMIQLASPLAFNILPGGRLQVGQPVVSGAHFNIPAQMPLQVTGGAAGHIIQVSNAPNSGVNAAAVAVVSSGQVIAKKDGGTETLPSRVGTIMSPVTQGITTGNHPLPIGLLNPMVGGGISLANIQSLPGNTQATQPIDARFIQPKTVQASQITLQPGIAPGQITQAVQYANIGPGIAPIPVFPVTGLGGLQFLPQVIPTQLVNALRGTAPQSPQMSPIHPQFVSPGNAYTIPMSPLNLSNILPTAVSLAQLPIIQQHTLGQHVQHASTQPQIVPASQQHASAPHQFATLPNIGTSTQLTIGTLAQQGITGSQEIVTLNQPIQVAHGLPQTGTIIRDELGTPKQVIAVERPIKPSAGDSQHGISTLNIRAIAQQIQEQNIPGGLKIIALGQKDRNASETTLSLGQSSGQSLGQSLVQSSRQAFGQTSGQSSGQTLGQTLGQSSEQSPAQSSGQTLRQSSGQPLGQSIFTTSAGPEIVTLNSETLTRQIREQMNAVGVRMGNFVQEGMNVSKTNVPSLGQLIYRPSATQGNGSASNKIITQTIGEEGTFGQSVTLAQEPDSSSRAATPLEQSIYTTSAMPEIDSLMTQAASTPQKIGENVVTSTMAQTSNSSEKTVSIDQAIYTGSISQENNGSNGSDVLKILDRNENVGSNALTVPNSDDPKVRVYPVFGETDGMPRDDIANSSMSTSLFEQLSYSTSATQQIEDLSGQTLKDADEASDKTVENSGPVAQTDFGIAKENVQADQGLYAVSSSQDMAFKSQIIVDQAGDKVCPVVGLTGQTCAMEQRDIGTPKSMELAQISLNPGSKFTASSEQPIYSMSAVTSGPEIIDQTGTFVDQAGTKLDISASMPAISLDQPMETDSMVQQGLMAQNTGTLSTHSLTSREQACPFFSQPRSLVQSTLGSSQNLDVSMSQKSDNPQKITTSEQSSIDAGTLGQQTGTLEQQAGTFANQTGTFANQTCTFEKPTGTLGQQDGTFENRTGTFENRTGTFENRTGTFENQTGSLEQQTGTFENQTGTLEAQIVGSTKEADNLTLVSPISTLAQTTAVSQKINTFSQNQTRSSEMEQTSVLEHLNALTHRSQTTEVTPISSEVSSNQALPHLQQLIYKQLQQQQQQQNLAKQADGSSKTQSDSSFSAGGNEEEQNRSGNPVSKEASGQETPDSSLKGEEQPPSDGQPVDWLRFLQQARTEELSKLNLQKQLQEAQLETQIYKDELEKAQKELLSKEQEEIPQPPVSTATDVVVSKES